MTRPVEPVASGHRGPGIRLRPGQFVPRARRGAFALSRALRLLQLEAIPGPLAPASSVAACVSRSAIPAILAQLSASRGGHALWPAGHLLGPQGASLTTPACPAEGVCLCKAFPASPTGMGRPPDCFRQSSQHLFLRDVIAPVFVSVVHQTNRLQGLTESFA